MTNMIKAGSHLRRLLVGSGLLCVLAVPAVADGQDAKLAKYKSRGLVVATSPTTVTVCVGTAKKSANKRAAAWRGMPVVFDIEAARLKVRDIDGDGFKALSDIEPGDRLTVTARLPKDLSGVASPFTAEKVSISYKKKIKLKDGFQGGVCPEWTDDDPEDLDNEPDEDGGGIV